jgi:hypothetical protein
LLVQRLNAGASEIAFRKVLRDDIDAFGVIKIRSRNRLHNI